MSMTMWALLPRIFRFRSALKPPMTLTAPESENDPSATAKIDKALMSVRKPLFFARTWRAATNDANRPPSSRSSTRGMTEPTRQTMKTTPTRMAPLRTRTSFNDPAEPRKVGSLRVHSVSATRPPRDATVRTTRGRTRRIGYFSGRSRGKRMTSRMDGACVSAMTRRSIPMPNPAVGGIPCSSART